MPRPKLRFKPPKKDKLLLHSLSRRQRLKDKESRMRRLLSRPKERKTREELRQPSKPPSMLPIERLLLPIESRNSRLKLPPPRPDPRLISRLLRMLSKHTLKSSRSKDLPTKLDSRPLPRSRLPKSRLLRRLPKRPTSKLWPPERLKKRDKLPTMPRKWPRESPNSENNSNMFGFQDQLASLR